MNIQFIAFSCGVILLAACAYCIDSIYEVASLIGFNFGVYLLFTMFIAVMLIIAYAVYAICYHAA